MTVFKHKFFGWLEADAYRHINPDGSEGAIVAVSARIAAGLTLRKTVEVGPDAGIGYGVSIGARAFIGEGVSIGYGVSIGKGSSIGYGSNIGAGVSIGARSGIGYGSSIGDGSIIGKGVSIGYGVSIGARAFIGKGVSIGYGVSISEGASIGAGEWWIAVGPQGSRNAMLTAVQKPEGLRWWVGCKHNIDTATLRELVAESHAGTDHEVDYLHVIAFVEGHPARLRAVEAGQTAATTTRNEVMPDDNDNSNPRPDTSPGVTAGADTATPAQDVAGIAARIKRIKDELLTRASAEPDDVAYAYRDAATALDVMFEYEPLARMKEAGE